MAETKGTGPKRKVLLALDGSANSDYALKWYLEKCQRPDDEIVGVHIYQQPHLPTFSLKSPFQPPTEEWERIMKEIITQCDKVENDFVSICQGQKITSSFSKVQSKNPGEAIIDCAKNHQADMIVMGTRGLSTLRRTVLGSVSDYILHHSSIPVAVVPKPEESS